jgi:branched-chain amino acid transport system ATP-binding protein
VSAGTNGTVADATTGRAGVGEALVELAGFGCGYGGVQVVHGVDLSVHAGEVVALLGPNGVGKSTTLLGIAGLLGRTSGRAVVLGEPIDSRRPHRSARRGVALVPEDRGLLPGLTVEENLRLGRRGAGRSADDDEVLDLFPALAPLRRRRAGLLSGGEQQMLSLARALVGRPRLLLIDEMSLGLAPLIVRALVTRVREIATASGVGVLMVEQHVHMALSVADRAYAMNKGRIVMEGTAAEVAAEADRLTAGYLGAVEPGGASDDRPSR